MRPRGLPFLPDPDRVLPVALAAVWGVLLDALAGLAARSPALEPSPVLGASLLMNVAVWGWTLLAAGVLGRLILGRCPLQGAARQWLRGLGWGCLGALALAWLVGWVFYDRTGSFLGLEGLRFFCQNLRQLLPYLATVERANLPIALFGAAGLAWGGVWVVTQAARLLRPWAARLIRTLLVGLLASTLMLVAGGLKASEPFTSMVRKDLGPLAHLVFDTIDRLHRPAPEQARELAQALELLRLRLERQMPMSMYLRSIDRSRARRYNVILVLVESLRADRLQRLGAVRPVMPHLDRLAERSVLFANAYANSSHSDYADLCPLASQYPLRSRYHHYYEPLTYPRVLLYDLLKALGYRTAMFSSQDERWGGMARFLDTGGLDVFFHGGSFSGPTYVPEHDVGVVRRVWEVRGQRLAGKIEDAVTLQAALDWIESSRGGPFFLSINFQNSHFPYRLPQGAEPTYRPVEIAGHRASTFWYPKALVPVMQNRYDNSLHYIDGLLGTLLERLAAWGLADHTILAVIGDTGQAFHEHGTVTHASRLWNEVLRVPWVLAAPGLVPQVVTHPVEQIDVAPTILQLLGLPPHPAFQGRDALRDDGEPRSLFAVAQSPLAYESAVIRGDYKLRCEWQGMRYALYDLRRDPTETTDRAHELPEVFQDLQRRLDRWHREQLLYYGNPRLHRRYYPPRQGAAFRIVNAQVLGS